MVDINPAWLKIGFEISDGWFNFIVIDVHADTVESFDSEGVRDLQSHEEWHYAVTEMLKDGGEVQDEPLDRRLASWTEFHPGFPALNVKEA
jgi:hypothetical protein